MSAYITVEEADAYFSDRLLSDFWASASYEDKTKALNMATREINTLSFVGTQPEGQVNKFPRVVRGELILPDQIKWACAEQALLKLDPTYDEEREFANLGVLSEGLTGTRVTYDRESLAPNQLHGFSAVAWKYLFAYLKENRVVIIRRVS